MYFDGTWNTVENRTNVSRLFETTLDRASDDSQQMRFYDEGVGRALESTTPWMRFLDGIRGGIFGDGIVQNVLQAYSWLIEHYRDDALSELYIFGFSRGAFTARLLAGLLGASGILKREEVIRRNPISWTNSLVQTAWARYKPGRSAWRSMTHKESVQNWEIVAHPVAIKFLGVWDTVGRYGVPKLGRGGGLFKPIRFNDCRLGRHVQEARHAMAIDEHRADFDVRLWDGVQHTWSSERLTLCTSTRIVQRWFSGAHAQVGGGYQNDQLCHYPLEWMALEAKEIGLGLMHVGPAGKARFRLAPMARDYLAPVVDSHKEFACGLYKWISDPITRRILIGSHTGEGFSIEIDIDASVTHKVLGDAMYRPVNLYHQGRLDLHTESGRS
ncbi:MAG: DUF2235 domain-containing protein [Nitrospira sp.]